MNIYTKLYGEKAEAMKKMFQFLDKEYGHGDLGKGTGISLGPYSSELTENELVQAFDFLNSKADKNDTSAANDGLLMDLLDFLSDTVSSTTMKKLKLKRAFIPS